MACRVSLSDIAHAKMHYTKRHGEEWMWGEDVTPTTCPRAGCAVVCRGLASLAHHVQRDHESLWLLNLRSKEGPDRVRCEAPGCQYTYSSRSHMARHMRTKHPDCVQNDTLHYCTSDHCIASFPTKRGLGLHMRHCRKTLAQSGDSDERNDSADGARCEICTQDFATRHRYLIHRAMHQKYGHIPYKIT